MCESPELVHKKHLVVIWHTVVNKGWLLTNHTNYTHAVLIPELLPQVGTCTRGHLLD